MGLMMVKGSSERIKERAREKNYNIVTFRILSVTGVTLNLSSIL
jgi:hypothetical protein